ncbi:MAG TPA: hypothetical protein VGD73_18315 [Pseudonocardia sp.]|jgi:hypothetical protein|uniref:hypothetical protein n=1 Tax=Pseudonocardia sp. TaxID=60912 RepID=UPI002EDA3673
MSPTTRRMLPIATAVAVALSLSACASPWAKGGHAGSTSSSSVSTSDSAAENAAANSTSGNGQAASPGSALPPANALSPNDQAEYCKRTSPLEVALPSEDGRRQPSADLKRQAEIWTELANYSPGALRTDVALLANDYQALADGSRTLPQVDNEVQVAFGRVNDYRNLICLTQEERDKTGN